MSANSSYKAVIRPCYIYQLHDISPCYHFQVDWGEASMIEAERILLRHALTDPLNDRFVFLSDR